LSSYDFRVHLNTHSKTDALCHAQLLQQQGFFLCPFCTTTAFYLGKQGLGMHRRNKHANDIDTNRCHNIEMIHDAFNSAEYDEEWTRTLHWLYTHELPPPPYRNSLWTKLNSTIRRQVLDTFLQFMHILYAATLATAPTEETEATSLLPLFRLLFYFETVMLAPPCDGELRQYKKLIPTRLKQLKQGLFSEIASRVYNCPPRPLKTTTTPSRDSINRSVETAIRNGDIRTAMTRLNPLPRA